MSILETLLDPIPIPRMVKVKQNFEHPSIKNPEEEFLNKLADSGVLHPIMPNQKIAVAVGSRGITNQPLVVKLLVRELKRLKADPFLVPAMGSHGGATAVGQKSMLVNMGFNENYIGAPIRAAMEVLQIGTTDNNLPVYFDKLAYEADGVVIVNRIKPHVAFRGKFESGLMKMIAIGLGKQQGASICHELGFGRMAENIPAIGRLALQKSKILFGIGLLENACHETYRIEILRNEEIEIMEPLLLEEARRFSPKLFFDNLDVLIIDEIGKDISGTGFDTNVVGRYHTPYASGGPNITRIAVLDITNKSHGNANGLGIADFTTRRAYGKFVFDQTYPNSLTTTVPLSVKIPMVLKNDRHAIQAAVKTCNLLDKTRVRMVRIKNTLRLNEIEVSENLIDEVKKNSHLDILAGPYDLRFDAQGNLF
ncbi:MAG: lactate racemase domain-containing protein [Spirochaetota bacterium]